MKPLLLLTLILLVGCASAPAPAVQSPSAWRQCVDLVDRANYQEAAYMASIGLPFEYKSVAERWAPCEGLPKAGSQDVLGDEDPNQQDRTNRLLELMLLNQLKEPRR